MAPIWQSPLWPRFQHDPALTEAALAGVMQRIGTVHGLLQALIHDDCDDQLRRALMREVTASLALDGLSPGGAVPGLDAVVDRLNDARNRPGPLTVQHLHDWHGLLCDGAGQWRVDALEIVGARDEVLYTAPPPDRIAGAMTRLLDWLNGSGLPLPIRAALVHLWCDTIQPFEEGSGVITRALSDHVLASDGALPIALSSWIATDRRGHFTALQAGRSEGRGGIDATPFVLWYLHQLGLALAEAEESLRFLVLRNRFFLRFGDLPPRPRTAFRALFAAGPVAVEEGVTASLYADLARTSIPTGTRDLAEMEAAGIVQRGTGGGRSTRYFLVL